MTEPRTNANDVLEEGKRLVDTAMSFLRTKQEDTGKQLEEQMTRMAERIDALREEARERQGEAAQQAGEGLDEARKRYEEARQRLEQVRASGPDAAEDLKRGAERAIGELQGSLTRAADRLKRAPETGPEGGPKTAR